MPAWPHWPVTQSLKKSEGTFNPKRLHELSAPFCDHRTRHHQHARHHAARNRGIQKMINAGEQIL